MSNILENKVVIITGASSGIGAASARLLAEHGCKLTLAARSLEKLEALADDLSVETLAVRADMTAPADITNMVKRTLDQFGRIDVMFANAGVFIMGDYASGDPDAYSNLLTVNVDGVLRCIHAVIPAMKAAGCGDILITSSIAGHEELHLGAVYGASKHAIQTIVHTLRRQLAADGIRVMSLAPGRVANELWGLTDPEEIERLSVGEHNYLTVEDVAEAAVFMLTRPAHVTVRDLLMLPQKQDV